MNRLRFLGNCGHPYRGLESLYKLRHSIKSVERLDYQILEINLEFTERFI